MKRFDTHVCLVSDQAAPNLLPLIDREIAPSRVVLLVTPQKKKQAAWLQEVIHPSGIRVDTHSLNVDDSFDSIQEFLMELLAEEDQGTIALNVTGGTKWLAIAAQEVFRANDFPVFYVDVATDLIKFIGGKTEPHRLTQSINTRRYLNIYGYRIDEESDGRLKPEYFELCQQLVLRVNEWAGAIGCLNMLANEAQSKGSLQISMELEKPNNFDVLLHECEHVGLLTTDSNSRICFADEEAREFCNGGWLEFYTNKLLCELKGKAILQDTPHLNVKVSREGVKNEIDVAFMAKNRLHLIECKTKKFTGKTAGAAGAEAVYKLDSLSDLGGIGTKSMLLSYRKLRDADKQRAKDIRIKVVEGDQLHNLKSILHEWISS